jgi:16S rRNA (guanine966-N2)-methyltransferase
VRHAIRIIGGRWKRTRLPVPDRPGLRPTPDRVRETLFNWLGQDLSGWRVLDAFAGTGALGWEAASRGAVRTLLLERDALVLRQLRATRDRLGAAQVEVREADALAWMASAVARNEAGWDLILLDPPFAEDVFAAALASAAPLLAPEAWVYLEADRAFDPAELRALGWAVVRHQRFGAVHAHLLQAQEGGPTPAAQSALDQP